MASDARLVRLPAVVDLKSIDFRTIQVYPKDLRGASGVAIEYRWAEGRFERLAEFAAEFVRQGVDIIVAEGSRSQAGDYRYPHRIPDRGGPRRKQVGC